MLNAVTIEVSESYNRARDGWKLGGECYDENAMFT